LLLADGVAVLVESLRTDVEPEQNASAAPPALPVQQSE
jgi:hypothetical protein